MLNCCSICMNTIECNATLNCFHSFCNDCLNKWTILEDKNNCPICRDEITSLRLDKNHKMKIEKYIKYFTKNKYIYNISNKKTSRTCSFLLFGLSIGIGSIIGLIQIYNYTLYHMIIED